MSPEQFRQAGHALIDWIADYRANIANYPVLSQVAPNQIRQQLPPSPPAQGEPFSAVMHDVETILLDGVTHWQSPNFYAYFPATSSEPAILGDLLSSGLGVLGLLWQASPACTELETLMLDWAAQMLELPPLFHSTGSGGGVIQESASGGTLVALLTARERATAWRVRETGDTRNLVVYATAETHSSFDKAVIIAGIGRENIRRVPTDERGAMLPDALAQMIAEDRASGLLPTMVCATVGTTSTTAIDPLRPIGELCRAVGVWFHVDAAMAGAFAVCPEHRPILDGVELADSFLFNPHKMWLVNFDCSCYFVADRQALTRTLSITPEYLKTTDSADVIQYRDWQLPLGRRFRALKLWFVIRHYGVEGLRQHLRHTIALTQKLQQWIAVDPDWEIVAPVPLNLICFAHRDGDQRTEAFLHALNASGKAFLSHTKINGRYVLRWALGGVYTQEHHLAETWRFLQALAREAHTP